MAKPFKRKTKKATQAVNKLHSSKPSLRSGPLPRIARSVLRELNSQVGRSVLGLLDGRKFIEVAGYSMPNPSAYASPSQFARDYLAYSLLRKSVALETGIDTQKVAFQKWFATEEACSIANSYGGKRPDLVEPCLHGLCEQVLNLAREKIRQVLGVFSWNEAIQAARYSGGASTRLPRRYSHPANKFLGPYGPATTRDCATLAMCSIWSSPLWRMASEDMHGTDPFKWFHIRDYARLSTVPKDAGTDRVTTTENELNMYFQLAIGSMIRSRLARVGINLNDQKVNQELARLGSLGNDLATVDLSSASDTISSLLVFNLLPPDWFDACDLTRSKQVLMKSENRFVLLEKFSSMGNGFTFELESLIFWAITSACVDLEAEQGTLVDKRLSVYGDDIICHRNACDLLYVSLTYCGFTVNVTKSYDHGPFRESCGKHYFSGTDVTPFYVKEQGGALQDVYWFANSVRLWCGWTGIALPQSYHQAVLEATKQRKKPHLVPLSFGLRAGLICNFDEAHPPLREPRPWPRFTALTNPSGYESFGGFVVKQLVPRRRKQKLNAVGAYLFVLSGMKEYSERARESTPVEVVDTGDLHWGTSVTEVSWWDDAPSTVSLSGKLVS